MAEAARAAGGVRSRAGTVRVQTTLGAVAVVGVALVVGAVALVLMMRATLTRGVRNGARLRANDVVAALAPGGAVTGGLSLDGDEDVVVRVFDGAGRVVASTRNLGDEPELARLAAGRSAQVDLSVDENPFIAVAVPAAGGRVVVVARSLDSVYESTAVVIRLLAGGIPLLLLVVAGTTWKVAGRALAPVDAMRREVDAITAAELNRRVPSPPGHDEIARLAATMNRMLDRLEQAQARQRRFISDASHELRSPVASIRQHAEVARSHPSRVEVGDLADTVLADEQRLERLIEDLLLLARVDEHALDLRRRPVDLDDLVLDEARRLRTCTSIHVDTSAVAAGRIDGDAASLRRVVANLATNAARHARSRVAFGLAERSGFVVLAVDDDGPGIPAGDRQRVLDRFVRLDDARAQDGGGSGLGLAIVADLVAAHGGSVAIVDSPLGGARVELTFSVPSGAS